MLYTDSRGAWLGCSLGEVLARPGKRVLIRDFLYREVTLLSLLKPTNLATQLGFMEPRKIFRNWSLIQSVNSSHACWPCCCSTTGDCGLFKCSAITMSPPPLGPAAPASATSDQLTFPMPSMEAHRQDAGNLLVHHEVAGISVGRHPWAGCFLRCKTVDGWQNFGQVLSPGHLGKAEHRSLLLRDRNSQTQRWLDKDSGFDYQLMELVEGK